MSGFVFHWLSKLTPRVTTIIQEQLKLDSGVLKGCERFRLNTSWPLWRTRQSGSLGWASHWPLYHGKAGRCCKSAIGPPSSGPSSRQQIQYQTGSHRGCPQSASVQNEPATSTQEHWEHFAQKYIGRHTTTPPHITELPCHTNLCLIFRN